MSGQPYRWITGGFAGSPSQQLTAVRAASAAERGLQRLDLLGLRPLGPVGRVLNPLILLKAAVTVSLGGAVVNVGVVGAVIGVMTTGLL